jgi:type I restriction enzyme R subunit
MIIHRSDETQKNYYILTNDRVNRFEFIFKTKQFKVIQDKEGNDAPEDVQQLDFNVYFAVID